MKQTTLLALLCALLAGIVLWRMTGNEALQTAGGRSAMNAAAAASAAPAEDNTRVRLDLLGKAPVSASPKNIFASLQSLAPPPLPPVVELPPLPDDIEVPPPPSPESLALAAAQKALAEIRLVGYVRKGGDRQTGIFSWTGKIETGGIGDPIFGRFRVKGLTATTANIEEAVTHAEISLQLNERR